jgi:putative pyruvate formate lyase activating enzyme
MSECDPLPTVVWKSDFFGTPEAFSLLGGVVDVYVADFKFGNDGCAKRIASVDDYVRIVTRNLKIAADQADLIVRHLLLPGHFDCCYRPIVNWMQRHLPAAKFSIRDGYLPRWQARHYDELSVPLKRGVGAQARELAAEQGLRVIV